MRRVALLIIALLLPAASLSQPVQVSFKGARVLAGGRLLACGQAESSGALYPLLVLIDLDRGTGFSAYLELDAKGVFLDAVESDSGIVAVGYLQDSPFSRSMLFTELRGNGLSYEVARAIKLSPGFGDGVARSVVSLRDSRIVIGLSQNPDTGVSDLAVINVKRGGEIGGAVSLGVPYYHSFVEKAYAAGEEVLLVGATWSYNVSMSDALAVYVKDSKVIRAFTLGGAGVDEGLAALHGFNGMTVLAGLTRSSSKGYSDGFYALVGEGGVRAAAFGTPGYDGFVDLIPFDSKLYLLGYRVTKNRGVGVILLVEEDKPFKAVEVACDRDLVPLAIGQHEGRITAVFGSENSLVVLTLNEELKPLHALTIGYTTIDNVNVAEISDLEKRREELTDRFILRTQSLVSRDISLTVEELEVSIRRINLPAKSLKVVAGGLEEKEPLPEVILRVIEENIPLLILLLPLIIVVIALVIATLKR